MGKINLHVSRIPPSRATKLQIWVGRRWVGRSTFLSTVPSLPAVANSSELHREKERENSLSSVTKAAGMAISGSPVALLFPWGTRLSQALWFSYVGEQVIQPPGLMLLVTNGVANIFFKKIGTSCPTVWVRERPFCSGYPLVRCSASWVMELSFDCHVLFWDFRASPSCTLLARELLPCWGFCLTQSPGCAHGWVSQYYNWRNFTCEMLQMSWKLKQYSVVKQGVN